MIFRQIIHDDLGCASYLIGDEHAGVAAVVDPQLDIDEYLRLARYLGVRIEHVLETHNHADHVSGHGRLAAATGATIHIHREAGAEYEHEPFDDGWELELGSLRVRALHTPGHRPEHTAFALIDTARGTSRGRCSAATACSSATSPGPTSPSTSRTARAASSARCTSSCSTLPDAREVWPGHLGGSLCGGPGMDLKVSSTIGFERGPQRRCCGSRTRTRSSRARDRRAGAAAAELPAPSSRSTAGRWTGARSRRVPLTPRQVQQARDDGALIVDVRTALQFDEAHIPGSVCDHDPARRLRLPAGLAGRPRPADIVVVGRDDEDARARDRARAPPSACATSAATWPAA